MAGFAVTLKNAIVMVVIQVAVDAVTGCIHKLLRLVTIFTVNVRVFPEQWKSRQFVIEKRCIHPLGFVVTAIALLTQLSRVWIVVLVTRHAVSSRRHLEHRLYMTIIAGDVLVRPVQSEVCCTTVIESRYVPGLAGMTCFAILTAAALVVVVFQVTADASHLHDIRERVRAVAIGAGKGRVFEFEWEVGVAVVVKAGIVPRAWVVAVLALLATAPLVRVVLGMTAVAGRWRVLVRLVRVTI